MTKFIGWRVGKYSAAVLILLASVWSQTPNSHMPRPGSINYVEGEAFVDDQPLDPKAAGSVDLAKGQSLTTKAGKVELLLTPGVFFRLGENSAATMTSPELENTMIKLVKGRSLVEVLDIRKENNIRVEIGESSAKLLSKGLYDFDADRGAVRVFKGKAELYANDRKIKIGGEHQLEISTATDKWKSVGFDTRAYEDDFFRWSALRSGYLSEASVDEARVYIGPGPGWYGPGWYGPGWYWDPWFSAWTFIPATGIFYSPFGWGFYSPIFVYRSPFFYGGYYGHVPHRFGDFHYPYGHGFEPRGGFHGGGFRGTMGSGGGRRG